MNDSESIHGRMPHEATGGQESQFNQVLSFNAATRGNFQSIQDY